MMLEFTEQESPIVWEPYRNEGPIIVVPVNSMDDDGDDDDLFSHFWFIQIVFQMLANPRKVLKKKNNNPKDGLRRCVEL